MIGRILTSRGMVASSAHVRVVLMFISQRILLRLRHAAGPHTRLLLADYILPLACVDEDDDIEVMTPGSENFGRKWTREPLPGTVRTLAPEGSPLLPNLGKSNANAYWLDLTVSSPIIFPARNIDPDVDR